MASETDSSLAPGSRLSRYSNSILKIILGLMPLKVMSFENMPLALCLITVVLSSVLAAGCASSGPLRNVYLLSLQSPTIEVRIGYFSLCVAMGGDGWSCSNGEFPESYTNMSASQPWDLLGLATYYRRQVTFAGLVLAVSALMLVGVVLLATFPRWRNDFEYDSEGEAIEDSERLVKPFPSKPILSTSVLALLVGTILSLTAALWQHSSAASTAATIHFVSKGEVTPTVGIAATVLVWLNFGLCLLAVGMIIILGLSVAISARYAN